MGEAIGSALVTLGLRNNTERVDRGPAFLLLLFISLRAITCRLGTDDMELHVRFQAWTELFRDLMAATCCYTGV